MKEKLLRAHSNLCAKIAFASVGVMRRGRMIHALSKLDAKLAEFGIVLVH